MMIAIFIYLIDDDDDYDDDNDNDGKGGIFIFRRQMWRNVQRDVYADANLNR